MKTEYGARRMMAGLLLCALALAPCAGMAEQTLSAQEMLLAPPAQLTQDLPPEQGADEPAEQDLPSQDLPADDLPAQEIFPQGHSASGGEAGMQAMPAAQLPITYTKGRLTWGEGVTVDENGTACLQLFDKEYYGVRSANGENIVAPGTQGGSVVRLHNAVDGPVTYTAVLYRIRSNEELAVDGWLVGRAGKSTSSFVIPDNVNASDVIAAVSGELPGGTSEDIDVRWMWAFDESAALNARDTVLGNIASFGNPDEVTLGVYLVVEDMNSYRDPNEGGNDDGMLVAPQQPHTGDDSHLLLSIALLCASALCLALLLLTLRRERRR